MSGALKASTALAAKGLPFEVGPSAGSGLPIARSMVRMSGIGTDPFDVPVVARRPAPAAVSIAVKRTGGPPRWSFDRLWSSLSLENVVPLSFLCAVALILAGRFRGMRKKEGVTGVPYPPYGSYLSGYEDDFGGGDQ